MLFQQVQGLGQHDRLDAVAHVVVVPLLKHGHCGTAEDFQAEVQVRGVIQFAGQVILIKLVVARLVRNRVEEAAFT